MAFGCHVGSVRRYLGVVTRTLYGILAPERRDAAECTHHEVLEHLVARLAARRPILAEARYHGGVFFVVRAAVEWGGVLGVGGGCVGSVALLHGGGGGAEGWCLLPRRVADQRGRCPVRERHCAGRSECGVLQWLRAGVVDAFAEVWELSSRLSTDRI